MGYHILDYDIELVSEFGLCYKNKLPKELQRRLFTRKQWLEKGFVLRNQAGILGNLLPSSSRPGVIQIQLT